MNPLPSLNNVLNSNKLKEIMAHELETLLIGYSAVGKSTFLKYLATPEYRSSLSVLDGDECTTPYLIHYRFDPTVKNARMAIKLKNESVQFEQFYGVLQTIILKPIKQFWSEGILTLTGSDRYNKAVTLIQQQLLSCSSGFFPLSKLMGRDTSFAESICKTLFNDFLDILFHKKNKGDKINEKLLSEELQSFIRNAGRANAERLFSEIQLKAQNVISDSGLVRDTEITDYYEGSFNTAGELEKSLLAINNANGSSNGAAKTKNTLSIACLVIEVWIELPTNIAEYPVNFLDTFGLSHNGSNNITANISSLLSGKQYAYVLFFVKSETLEPDLEATISQIAVKLENCTLFPILTHVDKYTNKIEDDVPDDQFINHFSRLVNDASKKYQQVIKEACNGNLKINLSESLYKVTNKTRIVPEKYSYESQIPLLLKQLKQIEENSAFKFEVTLPKEWWTDNSIVDYDKLGEVVQVSGCYTDDIKEDLRQSVLHEYNDYIANVTSYHGHEINAIYSHFLSNRGHDTRAYVYKDISTDIFYSIRQSILKHIPIHKLTITPEAVSFSQATEQSFMKDFYDRFSRNLYTKIYNHLVINNMMPSVQDNWKPNQFYIDLHTFGDKLDKLYAIRKCITVFINNDIDATIKATLAETTQHMSPQRLVLRSR